MVNKKIVACSGYFSIIHPGHLRYLEEAKKLAGQDGELVVILNNDSQCKMDNRIMLLNQDERMRLLKAIRWVDRVVLSVDKDCTVCETLKLLKPDLFVKGGYSHNANVPEVQTCKWLGIKMVFGVGGMVSLSSRKMLNEVWERC